MFCLKGIADSLGAKSMNWNLENDFQATLKPKNQKSEFLMHFILL